MRKDYPFDQAPAVVVGTCGHGLAVIRALQEGQVPVIALEANLDLPGAQTRLAQVHPVEDINGHGLIEALLALRARVHCPNKPVLFLTNDQMSRTLAEHWDVLDPHYLLSWSQCRDRVTALLNKSNLAAHCKKQGLSYPTSRQLHAKSDAKLVLAAVGQPAIVKPARPLAGFKTAFPHDHLELELLAEAFEADLPFVVQKFVPGDESATFFCALYLDYGEVLARFDGRKLRSRPLGHTTIAESCVQDDVYRETLRFFSGMKISGPVSLELKRDAEGHLWVIEPTIGRTDFWIGLCTANQVNLPLAEYHSQLGFPQEQRTQRDCALWLNEDRDPGGRLWLALHPSLGLGTRHSAYLYFHKDDIAPALAFAKRIFTRWSSAILRRVRVLFALHHLRALLRFAQWQPARLCEGAWSPPPRGPGSLPSRRLQGKRKMRSTLRRLLHPLKEFGWSGGALYLLDRLMGQLSPSLGLYVYDLMVQPITSTRAADYQHASASGQDGQKSDVRRDPVL